MNTEALVHAASYSGISLFVMSTGMMLWSWNAKRVDEARIATIERIALRHWDGDLGRIASAGLPLLQKSITERHNDRRPWRRAQVVVGSIGAALRILASVIRWHK